MSDQSTAPKIAAICTAYFPLSHADVIVTRWLDPHPSDATLGFVPRTRIASLYVAQRPGGELPPTFRLSPRDRVIRDGAYDPRVDIADLVSEQYAVPMFGSVREALTLGGSELAVDAVLLIGEHGEYPTNEYGQIMYPRKELFDEIVGVFRASGRVLPLFCDKHLSWNMEWAREMVATIRELRIPFIAGSSIPHVGPETELGVPAGAEIEEAIGLFNVNPDSYGYHSLEFVESIVERRRGGESGIRAVTAFKGDDVPAALARGELPRHLFQAALAAARARPGDVWANVAASGEPPSAFVLEHVDGLRTTHLCLNGHLDDFAVAVRLKGERRIRASSLGGRTWRETFVDNFARLNREIERLFLTGESSVPLERNLLATLATATCCQALSRPGERIATPWLEIGYGS